MECPKCQSDDTELSEYWWDQKIDWQKGKYLCRWCDHSWIQELDELISEPHPDDGKEPREAYDPDYASEQYQKMIEGNW